MNANVGNIDRAIRILLGLGLITATLAGAIGVWGWLGVIPWRQASSASVPRICRLGFVPVR